MMRCITRCIRLRIDDQYDGIKKLYLSRSLPREKKEKKTDVRPSVCQVRHVFVLFDRVHAAYSR